MIFYHFDRWGTQLGTLQDVMSAVHSDEVNGEDSLTVDMVGDPLEKGDRIVWRDKFSLWHEHMVKDLEVAHKAGALTTRAYCVNSMAELACEYIVEKEPSGTATTALTRALEGTNWSLGTVNVAKSAKNHWYHISVAEALEAIVETYGGELEATIEVTGEHVTARKVNLRTRRGGDTGQLFTYGRNMSAISRIVDPDEVYTAVYGYGKGIQNYDNKGEWTGGYTRKITFGDINGGQDWVGDESAKQRYGLPDGKGGIKHAFGKVEFDDCEDPSELLALTKAYLAEVSKPRVSYTGTAISLAQGGYTNGEDTRAGDTVHIHDRLLDERLEGRALKVQHDLLDESRTTITLGNLARTMSGKQRDIEANLDWMKGLAPGWESAAGLTGSYIDAVISRWNEIINMDGGYVYWEEGEGITVYDKPIDQNPTKAIQLKGGSFRIANSRLSNGDWNWRTFGTGDGFSADVINVGQIKGGQNFWNLETGDMFFKQGTIQNAAGTSKWDLTNNTFMTNGMISDYMIANNMTATDMTATGTFTCGQPSNQLKVAAGKISGSNNGNEFAYMDFSAISGLYKRGGQEKLSDMQGVRIDCDGPILLRSPYLATNRRDSTRMQAGANTYNSTVTYVRLAELNGSSLDLYRDMVGYYFYNGLCLRWDDSAMGNNST